MIRRMGLFRILMVLAVPGGIALIGISHAGAQIATPPPAATGVGRIESIRRQDGRWVVLTS